MQHYRIGFANLDENNHYCSAVRDSLQNAVASVPNLELIYRDNRLSDDCALRNAQEFAAYDVDIAIFFHSNQRLGPKIRSILFPRPIIAVDIPIQMTNYFGANNHHSGELVGQALSHWVKNEWQGKLDHVIALFDTRILNPVKDRVECTIRRLQQDTPLFNNQIIHMDSNNINQQLLQFINDMHSNQHVAAIGFNAETTLFITEIIADMGCQDNMIVVGHGADANVLRELERPGTPLIGATAFYPEQYGDKLIRLIQRKLSGERIPINTYIDIDLYQISPTQ